jgi:hypothetical protein
MHGRLLPEPTIDRSDSFTSDTVSDLALVPMCSGVVEVHNLATAGTDIDVASGSSHQWIHVPGRSGQAPYGVASLYFPDLPVVRVVRRGFVILASGPPVCTDLGTGADSAPVAGTSPDAGVRDSVPSPESHP